MDDLVAWIRSHYTRKVSRLFPPIPRYYKSVPTGNGAQLPSRHAVGFQSRSSNDFAVFWEGRPGRRTRTKSFNYRQLPMSGLPDGEYLLTTVRWRRQDQDEAFRPLHGFTTGHLTVNGKNVQVSARFNDQFLSNRFSDLEEDGIPIVLTVEILETEDAYTLSCSAPILDRSGASYKLKVEGELIGLANESSVS